MEGFSSINPVWILVALAVAGAIGKGLFWLRDVHNVKNGWGTLAEDIRNDLKEILARLPPQQLVESASPLRLSKRGEEVSESMNAAEWAAQLAPNLAPEVAGKQPFEIDQLSDDYVETRLDAQETGWVARQAYESGVTSAAVRAVLRVVLRDELLQQDEQTRGNADERHRSG